MSSYCTDDTIAAIATAAGGAARGMLRVSGPATESVVAACFSASDGRPLSSMGRAEAIGGKISVRVGGNGDSARSGRALPDRSLAFDAELFFWPGNRSYTREPMAELHMVGSPPLMQAALAELCRCGARPAEPGEFTLRAFLAGRLDLTQAEAVLGLIDAQRPAERDTALAQLAGGLARPLSELRENLLQLLAELEAGLDFVDEDIEFISRREITERLADAGRQLDGLRQQISGRAVAQFDQVVLIGPPNAGKSSLFNALVKYCTRESRAGGGPTGDIPALVSPFEGTTRDYVCAKLAIDDTSFDLIDTAGVGGKPETASANEIDASARAHSAERQTSAAIRLHCVDASAERAEVAVAELAAVCDPARDLIVLTKCDVASHVMRCDSGGPAAATSSRSGAGIGELCKRIRLLLSCESPNGRQSIVASTADRCRESVRRADEAVRKALETVTVDGGDELIASELRVALQELGKVAGAVYTDDLLDRIFSTFCIGK